MVGRIGSWLLGAALLAAVVFTLWSSEEGADLVGRGSPAPGFRLPRLEGDAPLDLADLRGRVVLVNFWATWCAPCEAEMPAMERLYRRLAPEGFELVAISVDHDVEAVRSFRERLGLSFPILLDPDQQAAIRYQTFRFPESLLIGPDGVIVERYVGAKDWDAQAYVERIRRLRPAKVSSDPA